MSAVADVRNRPRIDGRVHGVIAGARVAARTGATELPVINPATEQTISVLQEADAGEVDAAVGAARDAFDRGPWPRLAVAVSMMSWIWPPVTSVMAVAEPL